VSRYANGSCIGNGAEMAHHLSLEGGLPGHCSGGLVFDARTWWAY
jgi:hypothetical protein